MDGRALVAQDTEGQMLKKCSTRLMCSTLVISKLCGRAQAECEAGQRWPGSGRNVCSCEQWDGHSTLTHRTAPPPPPPQKNMASSGNTALSSSRPQPGGTPLHVR